MGRGARQKLGYQGALAAERSTHEGRSRARIQLQHHVSLEALLKGEDVGGELRPQKRFSERVPELGRKEAMSRTPNPHQVVVFFLNSAYAT